MDSMISLNLKHPSRRDAILLGLGAFTVATAPWWLRRRTSLVRRSVPVMGTIGEIAVVHPNQRLAQHAIDAAIGQLRLVERTMTRFVASSDVGRANLRAALEPTMISQMTVAVIEAGLQWASSSNGAFDPCFGKAMELWDIGNRVAPPPQREISRLARRDLYKSLSLDTWRGSAVVHFAEEDVQIDLGGIAKGYGVDRAVAGLREFGIEHALINVGGDLYAIGESEDGDPWQVGIRSAEDPSRVVQTLEMANQAVATSGDYLQFFRYNNHKYHHLLDPHTGAPRVTSAHSITVTADTCMAADAAATTLFGKPRSEAVVLLRSRAPNARIV